MLGAVAPHEQGKASGAATAIRELAVALGIAVLATVFAGHGDLSTPAAVVAGVVPALWLAAALATAGVLAAITLPRAGKARSAAPAPTHERNDMPEHPQLSVLTGVATPRIRAARPDDHPAIRHILRTAYGQYREDIPAELWCPYLTDLLDLDQHARHGHLVVAEVDGEVAGYAAFYPDATIQRAGLAGRMGRRSRAGGASRLPRARRRRGAADRARAPGSRRRRIDVRLPHVRVHGHRGGALRTRSATPAHPQFDLDVSTLYGVRHRPAVAGAGLPALPERVRGRRTPPDASRDHHGHHGHPDLHTSRRFSRP